MLSLGLSPLLLLQYHPRRCLLLFFAMLVDQMYIVCIEGVQGKRPLGRPRRRWEDNIKMGFQEVRGVVGTGWSWLRIGTGGGHLCVR